MLLLKKICFVKKGGLRDRAFSPPNVKKHMINLLKFLINLITINVLLILQVQDIIFFYEGKTLNGAFQGVFEELETF